MIYYWRRFCAPVNRVVGRLLWQWTEDAERTYGNGTLLAESDDGDFWVPSKTRADWWDRRFSWLRLSHWRFYLNSRRRNELVCVEADS